MDVVPEKLHELLKITYDDLTEAEKNPEVEFAFNSHWYDDDDVTCKICLAGACIYNSTKLDEMKRTNPSIVPQDLGYQWRDCLMAIDDLRTVIEEEEVLTDNQSQVINKGLSDALLHFYGGSTDEEERERVISQVREAIPSHECLYEDSPKGFKNVLGNVIEKFKEVNY